jgi:FlaG/FlaF family flagellin (archaellin)
MRFDAAGVAHRFLENLAVGFVEGAVDALEHPVTLTLGGGAETVDVAGDFDLLPQRQALDAPDDGFDDAHSGQMEQTMLKNASRNSPALHGIRIR